MTIKRVELLLLLAASLAFLPACSPVAVSGHVPYRKVMGSYSADGPAETRVYGIGYDSREWDPREAIPAGKGRVVLLRQRSAEDEGAGLIFRINDKGDFLLGMGNALAWNHPAGTCKLHFRSYFAPVIGEHRLPLNPEPVLLTVSEGKTLWVLVTVRRPMFPVASPIGEQDAEKVLAAQGLKTSALPKEVEGEIPWLP